MVIIADSGSSKTNWIISDGKTENIKINTEGLNPNFTDVDTIRSVIANKVLPFTGDRTASKVFFYGSGCSDTHLCKMVKEGIEGVFPDAHTEVNSDLLGAARALLGNNSGIACILGTGSNSGLYDGNRIIANIPPLGFILGDEGSGSYLGKRLLSDYLKGVMPPDISNLFGSKYQTDKDRVIEKVYRGEFPNKYIAGFVVFLKDNIEKKYCRELIKEAFSDFISRNIKFYDGYDKLKISFTGSIAWHFRELLEEVMEVNGLYTGEILREPSEQIMQYHLKHY